MNKDYSYMNGNQFAKGNKPNITSFKKGNIAWNKNKKGTHFSPNTEFKKGQRGVNWLPVGSLSIRKDKNTKLRRFIKIAEPNKWIEYAQYIWIKNNGNIPKGFIVHHEDENTLNDNINNLSLLTRKQHFEIHKIGEKGRKILLENFKKRMNIKIKLMNLKPEQTNIINNNLRNILWSPLQEKAIKRNSKRDLELL